ncbi:MAG: hypothetical protein A2Z20_07080 [Bdellovibrionales bacterium RBG_16_40_8]|nr:MAG: hypothetical protein A2Z20_07080 [Bdellovibrionales bacterium RBG_16_40_8]
MELTKKRAVLVTTPIFLQTTKPNKAGFTLIEVLITVAIVAAVVALVLPKFNNRNNEMRSVVRKFMSLSRELRAHARLSGATYRLVIKMPEEGNNKKEEDNEKYEFWVEKAQGQVLNNYDPKNPPKLSDPKAEKKDDEPTSPFSPDTRIIKKPEVLPGGLQFESVELANIDRPIIRGIVYVHYFPTGFTDEAAIHLQYGEKLRWTIAIESLTGHVEVIDEFRNLEDLRAK